MEAKNITKLCNVTVQKPKRQEQMKKHVFFKNDDHKRRRNKHKVPRITIMDLPGPIMVEIFIRLPIKSIFRCKRVCKCWYTIIFSDSLFLNSFQTRFPIPCILFSYDYSEYSILELKADYDYVSCSQNKPIVLSPRFHLPDLYEEVERLELMSGAALSIESSSLVGSCNGFICIVVGSFWIRIQSLFICNPLLCEYVKIEVPKWEKRVLNIVYGFCCSQDSRQYKVLRSVCKGYRDDRKVCELEVYTLGVDEKWRNLGEGPFPRSSGGWGLNGNVIVNDALHWMDDETPFCKVGIYSFDVGTENVKSLPAPPGLKTISFLVRLGKLGDFLCMLDSSCSSNYIDVWWMKEYGVLNSWTKDRILTSNIRSCILAPILIWKDGEILMHEYRGTRFFSYNQKEKKLREVKAYNVVRLSRDRVVAVSRYIPSFTSLKTIVGDNYVVSNVYPTLRKRQLSAQNSPNLPIV